MTKEEKIELLENKVQSLIQDFFKTKKEIHKILKELIKLDESYQVFYDQLMENENKMKKENKTND